MAFGWMGAILDIDLTTGAINRRDSLPYMRASPAGGGAGYIGGRALACRLAWEEIPADAVPYDPQNCIIITTGPFTGTLAPTAGRTVMGSLSPRVYPQPWYTHSTIGGWFGPALKYAGYDALIIRGRSPTPVWIEIRDSQVRLVDASGLWGRGTRDTQLALLQRLGPRAQVLAIGPAGEKRVRFAIVQHAEENAAGHSGFGAVWGSKNLKAVAVLGTGAVEVADREALLSEVLNAGKFRLAPSTRILAPVERMREKRPVCSQACTFNCLVAMYGQTADGRRLVGHCVGGTPWLGAIWMKASRYSGGGVEIPSSVNFDRPTEALLHQQCNDLGLDLWFRLVMQPWFHRCRQLGVSQIRGYPLEPDDPAWFEQFMHDLAYRRALGDLFAEDLRRAVDELEGELPAELIDLGRRLEFAFGFPAHREGRFWDEEPLPFWLVSALMYASESRDPTIGSHQSYLLLADLVMGEHADAARRKLQQVSQKLWGFSDGFDPTYENKAPVAIWTQHEHMLIDSLPLCDFAFPQLVRPFPTLEAWERAEDVSGDLDLDLRLFAAITGESRTRQELTLTAERAFTLERLLLARAGRTRPMEEALAAHFKLPCRADGTLIDEQGFSRILDQYYAARGWDPDLGWPREGTLARLGLQETIPELRQRLAGASPRAPISRDGTAMSLPQS